MTTDPLNESPDKPDLVAVQLRLDSDLVRRIDERRTGLAKELSRNAWVSKTLDWVLTYLPTGIAHPDRDRVASEAPADVAGTERVPRQGVDYGNPALPTEHVHRFERKGEEKVCAGCGEVRRLAPKEDRPF